MSPATAVQALQRLPRLVGIIRRSKSRLPLRAASATARKATVALSCGCGRCLLVLSSPNNLWRHCIFPSVCAGCANSRDGDETAARVAR